MVCNSTCGREGWMDADFIDKFWPGWAWSYMQLMCTFYCAWECMQVNDCWIIPLDGRVNVFSFACFLKTQVSVGVQINDNFGEDLAAWDRNQSIKIFMWQYFCVLCTVNHTWILFRFFIIIFRIFQFDWFGVWILTLTSVFSNTVSLLTNRCVT